MNTLLLIIAICYIPTILYIHSKIIKTCKEQEKEQRKVIGIITDTRTDNLINKDLK